MLRLLWITDRKDDWIYSKALIDLEDKFDCMVQPTQSTIDFSTDGDEALDQLFEKANEYDLLGGRFPPQLWISLMKYVSKYGKLPFRLYAVVEVPVVDDNGEHQIECDHVEVFE